MTTLRDGTEYLDNQEREIYLAVKKLSEAGRTTNSSMVARYTRIGRTTVTNVLHHLRARGFIRNAGKGAAYHWRVTDKPAVFWRDRDTLAEFIRRFAPDGRRVVAEVTTDRDEHGDSPFIIVRDGDRTAVICVMALGDDEDGSRHLCIDVHPFLDDREATASVVGIVNGRDVQLPPTGTTSFGRPSLPGIASVIIGAQGRQETGG